MTLEKVKAEIDWFERLEKIETDESRNETGHAPFSENCILLLTAICLTNITLGIATTFPSVLNPAILSTDTDIKATPDQASWITACFGISGVVAYLFMPLIFENFGRKAANIVTNASVFIGSIICAAANGIFLLAFARLCQGVSIPGLTVFSIGLCECVAPKRRGYFMVLNKISMGLGGLLCHSLKFVLSWRQIAIFGAIPVFLSLIICLITAESPSYFAFRGQFDKCSESFIWYRGDSINVTKELDELITAQTKKFRMKEKEKHISVFTKTKNMVLTKQFQKSFYIVTLAKLCLDWSGRYFVLAYITDILVEITSSESLAMYLSIVSDVILIISLCISSFLVRRFNRRSLLFKLGFASAFLMFAVSLSIIFLNQLNLVENTKWFTPAIIFIQVFITNIGLVPLAFTLTGEVYSLEHKCVGSIVTGVVFLGCYTLILKMTPILIDKTGVEGVYSIYGSCLLICLILLRIVLLETKDKTLQQIENELHGVVKNKPELETLNQIEFNTC